jgi:DNA-binding beta-propeller fold protein YncE
MKHLKLFLCLIPFCLSCASARSWQHEIWIMDQSDTTADGGGTLYIFDGADVLRRDATNRAEVIDLGGEARMLALAQTGTAPRRPHMMFFNKAHSHAIISFVTSGHVLFMDAATRASLTCIDVGVQAHAAVPSADQRYVVVANQNGKLLQRIRTDYTSNVFTLEAEAALDLANGTTPSGALRQDPTLRPDNAPICIAIDSTSRFGFVTLRGGGLFVVDITATPMVIVAEYDVATVLPHGCGAVEARGKIYINGGGGGAQHPHASTLYSFALNEFDTTPNAPNTPAPNIVFNFDPHHDGPLDSHGAALTKHDRFLWVADRAANSIVIVNTRADTVVRTLNLVGELSADPAPDLLGFAPAGHRAYVSLRGPNPLTGNNPAVDNAKGATPGLGILAVTHGSRNGRLIGIVPISHVVDGVERADPHGIAVRHIRKLHRH